MTVSPDLFDGYGQADMGPDSPVRERNRGIRRQPWGFKPAHQNVLSGFFRSPFFPPLCLTARLHSGGLDFGFHNRPGRRLRRISLCQPLNEVKPVIRPLDHGLL